MYLVPNSLECQFRLYISILYHTNLCELKSYSVENRVVLHCKKTYGTIKYQKQLTTHFIISPPAKEGLMSMHGLNANGHLEGC